MQNLVLGISRVIDAKEKAHWDGIRKLTDENPEIILYSIWDYLATLVNNQQDTYTDPFEVVTSNMSKYSTVLLAF